MDEDVIQDVVDDDEQYLEMLKGLAPRKGQKFDFEKSAKYSGSKRQHVDEVEDEIPRPLKKVKSTKKSSQPLQEQLRTIEKEDMQLISNTQEDVQKLHNTAQSLKQQFAYWRDLVSHRQGLQKMLEQVKRLPNQLDQFSQQGTSLPQIVQLLHSNINQLVENRNTLYNTGLPAIISTDTEGLFEQVVELCSSNKDEIEEDIIKWSQKTSLLGNIQKKQGLSGSLNFNSLLQTPIGQAQKALQNKDKLVQKSQLKRGIFRMLGEGPDDLHRSSSTYIFDDTDFYLELLQDSIVQADESSDMLTQATQQYLLQRRAQKQEQPTKDVDRRASKARKIKYEVHQKLINFMVPFESNREMEARDDIVRSLFGGVQESSAKKRSASKKDPTEITLI